MHLSRFTPLLFGLFFAASFMLLQYQHLHISHSKISVAGEPSTEVSLPYSLKIPGKQILHLDADIIRFPFSTTTLRIIPDDCIETLLVNGQFIDLRALKGRCDWSHGMTVDLGDRLHHGTNRLEITVAKKDGVGGINVFGTANLLTPWHIALSVTAMLALFGFILTLSRRTLELPLRILLGLAAVLALHYLSYTDYAVRTFDLLISTGHLDYIKMIAEQLRFPNPTQGWEYHQPPLYYLIAAAVYAFFRAVALIEPMTALQLLSLSLFIIFLYYGLRILQAVITEPFLRFIAASLLVFWPSGIIHSVRIGNDSLFYALFAAALYAVIRWKQGSSFWPALVLAALALITKANGIILFGIIGIVLLNDLRQTKNFRHFFRMSGLATVFFLAAFFVNFADNIYYAATQSGQDWLVSNVVNTINSKLFVVNDPFHYLYFDLKTYLKEPFIDAWHDRYGRQFFWNYLLKSSLFSEFSFPGRILAASVMSALSLLIFVYIGIGMMHARRRQADFIMFSTLILSILALLLYRIKIPVACNTDFRYIFPILIPMAFFFARAIEHFRHRNLPVPFALGIATLAAFDLGTFWLFF